MGIVKKVVEIIVTKQICKNKSLIWKGNRVRFRRDSQVIINNGGKIEVDDGLSVQSRLSLSAIGGNIEIGKGVAFNRNCTVVAKDSIVISDNCIFGPNVVVYDHDHIFSYDGVEKEKFRTDKVTIEEGCWIGANVTILKGTHIGAYSVIGAGCVIKGDIAPHSIVVSDRTNIVTPIVPR